MRVRLAFVVALTTLGFTLQTVASAATTTPAPSFGNPVGTVLKLFLFLGIIVALAIFLIKFLAKKSQVQSKGAIQVLAARQLAPNKSIQVVEVQGRKLLVGVGDEVTLLAEMTDDFDAELEEGDLAEPVSFGKVLADSLRAVRDRYRNAQNEKES